MRGGRAPPPPFPARANFTLMTECMPVSSGCNISNISQLEILLARKDVSQGWEGGGRGKGGRGAGGWGCQDIAAITCQTMSDSLLELLVLDGLFLGLITQK